MGTGVQATYPAIGNDPRTAFYPSTPVPQREGYVPLLPVQGIVPFYLAVTAPRLGLEITARALGSITGGNPGRGSESAFSTGPLWTSAEGWAQQGRGGSGHPFPAPPRSQNRRNRFSSPAMRRRMFARWV